MFRRLDANTGKVQWETNARGTSTEKYFFHGDVFIASDLIVASADVEASTGAEAGVHAFDRNSGRQLWKYLAGRGVPGAIVGLGPRVFAYAANGDLIALDLQSGKLEWRNPLKADGWESPGVSQGRVIAGSGDGLLYAFDGATGRVEWQRKLGAAVTTSVRATATAVYAGTADGVMHRLSANRGEALSSFKLDAALKPSSLPMIMQDAIFVLLTDKAADYRAVVSLDPELRRERWRQAASDRWTTSRVFATSKTIVLGTPSGEVTAYCAADGSPAWRHRLASAPIRSIGGSDEVLYVGTLQGTLYAIRPPASCM